MSPNHRTSVAAAIALAAALAITGCDRSGGAPGTTTIIQQAPATSSATAVSTSASVKVTPLDDPAQLCQQVRSRSRELQVAVGSYWELTVKPGWDRGDPAVQAAIKKIEDTSSTALPQLDGLVGPGAPSDLASTVKTFLKSFKDFIDAILSNAENTELNPLAHKYGSDLDALNAACKI